MIISLSFVMLALDIYSDIIQGLELTGHLKKTKNKTLLPLFCNRYIMLEHSVGGKGNTKGVKGKSIIPVIQDRC